MPMCPRDVTPVFSNNNFASVIQPSVPKIFFIQLLSFPFSDFMTTTRTTTAVFPFHRLIRDSKLGSNLLGELDSRYLKSSFGKIKRRRFAPQFLSMPIL